MFTAFKSTSAKRDCQRSGLRVSLSSVAIALASALVTVGISNEFAHSTDTKSQTGKPQVKSKAVPPAGSIKAPAAKIDAAAVSRGKAVFERSTCAGCHPGGENALMPSKAIKGESFWRKYKDDISLEDAIRGGFPDDGMPPFPKDKISAAEMKDLICYVRSLTLQQRK